jgi:Cu-processing system ATP-binding protein
MPILSTYQLSKHFGKLQVLSEIDISFEMGQAVAIIGPNASGKTTFIKCILGMVIPGKGEVRFKDQAIGNQFLYRKSIGYMPQIGRYPDNMTVGSLFTMLREIRHFDGEPDMELYHLFELEQIEQKALSTLSGGTRQKVSAALAFMFCPEILILDEPTAGLDPLASEILKEKILKEKQAGKLILITSHIMSDLDEICTHVMYLFDRKLRFFKSIEALKSETGEQKLGKAIAQIMKAETLSLN